MVKIGGDRELMMERLAGAGFDHGRLSARLARALEELKRLRAVVARAEDPLERLLLELESPPSQLCLVVADRLLEAGEDARAAAWAWLGRHEKYPGRVNGGWTWWRGQGEEPAYNDWLPGSLAVALGGVKDGTSFAHVSSAGKAWPTPRAALEAVVEVIVKGWWKIPQ